VKEKPLGKFFKLDALVKRDYFGEEAKILAPTMFPQGKGDYVDPRSNFPSGEMD
jgi:hypothetical protein